MRKQIKELQVSNPPQPSLIKGGSIGVVPSLCKGRLGWVNYLKAFTLAEVLITLGVIGIVAALTLPMFIAKYQEKVLITKLEKTYSILSNAFKLAVEENGSATEWGLEFNTAGADIFAEKMMPYLNVVEDCGLEKPYGGKCFAKNYNDYKGNVNSTLNWNTDTRIHTILLADGISVMFMGYNSKEARFPDGYIAVDITGKAGPNRAGVDLFRFTIYDNKLYPTGEKKPARNSYGWGYCGSKTDGGASDGSSYGWACTAWVLTNKNMDYIRCRDELDWDTKTSCK